jgi:hypothetical protein
MPPNLSAVMPAARREVRSTRLRSRIKSRSRMCGHCTTVNAVPRLSICDWDGQPSSGHTYY